MKLPSLLVLILLSVVFLQCSESEKINSKEEKKMEQTVKEQHPVVSKNSTPPIELKAIYAQAIQDFIFQCDAKYNLVFDTLYFGKHQYGQEDDFPDIELPRRIGTTTIRLISPKEGIKKQKQFPNSYYVNMVGWVNQKEASFILVAFSNGMAHQFDITLDYSYDENSMKFMLKN